MLDCIWNAISSAISSVKNWVEGKLKSVSDAIGNAVSIAKSYADSLFSLIRREINNIVDSLRGWVSNVIESVKRTVDSAIGLLRGWVEGAISHLRGFAQTLFEQAKTFAQGLFNNLQLTFRLFETKVIDFMNFASRFFAELPGKVWEWIEKPLTKWINQQIENFVNYVFEQINNFKLYVFENTITYTKTTYYENMKLISQQFNLPYPTKEEFNAQVDKFKEMGKRIIMGG